MQKNHLDQTLKSIGLQDKEIAVYKANVSLSIGTVTQIAQKAGLKRTNVYNILRSLKTYGLVSPFEEDKKLLFRALGAEAIENYIQEQIRLLNRQQYSIPDIQKELHDLQEGVKKYESTHVKVFEGKKASLQVWNDMLHIPEGETIYDIEASHNFFKLEGTVENYIDEEDFIAFAQRRIKKGIRVEFVSTAPLKQVKLLEQQNLMRFTDAVYISPDNWSFPVEIGIYANKLYILSFKKDPIWIIIENEDIAKAFKQLFDKFKLWALSLQNAKHVKVD